MQHSDFTAWQLAYVAPQALTTPDDITTMNLEWRAAEVPGSVQTSAFGLPLEELYQRDNIEKVRWMEEMYWVYRTEFVTPYVDVDEEVIIQFLGIDYQCRIYLNGRFVCAHEGMFTPVEIPLYGTTGKDELLVLILPFADTRLNTQSMKARYSFGSGWDFAPKMQSRGIWDDAGIIVREKLRATHAWVQTRLDNQQRADVTINVELSEVVAYGEITVSLDSVTRTFPIVQTNRLAIPLNISSPTLWWPNGLGVANLVELCLVLQVTGRNTVPFAARVGLRAVERVAAAGQGAEDIPLQLVVNHRKIFLKGVNWVPLDSCSGSITTARYRLFLQQFKDAGVNLVRVWGGGLKEKDAFYAIADELGLMVLQEFPLACEKLIRTQEFISLLAREVTAIIQALRAHPSVVIWSGGNELFHYWDLMDSGSERMAKAIELEGDWLAYSQNREWRGGGDTYDEPALALMGELCARQDGSRPYQLTSAMEGEGEAHGIWTWDPTIGDHRFRDSDTLYDFWLNANQHLYSESSVSSIANLETISEVLGEESHAYPDKKDPIWQLHHAFHAAWDNLPDLWLDLPSTEQLFGKLADLDRLVLANQWMQGEGGRFLIEELRRKMPHTCGIIWWGVNEPWPGLAGNALIDYYGRPKLGWQFIATAFKPTILSLRYPHCVARRVKPELWISHDGVLPFSGRYEVDARNLTTGETDHYAGRIASEPYTSQLIRTLLPIRLHAGTHAHITCRLYDGDTLLQQNDYLFASNEDTIPFDATMLGLIKELYTGE